MELLTLLKKEGTADSIFAKKDGLSYLAPGKKARAFVLKVVFCLDQPI
jgi:hypothetical protein